MYHATYGPPPTTYYASYDSQGYYSPRYPDPTATPTKPQRRATQDYAYTTPRQPSYQYAKYSSPGYTTYHRKPDHVSDSRSKPRCFEEPVDGRGGAQYRRKSGTPQTSRTYFVYPSGDGFESSEEFLPRYEERYTRTTPPPPYSREYQRQRYPDADYYYHSPQAPSYARADEPTGQRASRPRRASYAAKPRQTPPRPRPRAPSRPPAQATADDARTAGIPAGYSYKNWDPNEEPILLLGSVFDANSLGKWIYDWTVAWRGPATPISEVAGDLWLLLIQFAGKIKRAEERLPRIRREEHQDTIEDFLESGERLWQRFSKLLKTCETYMLKAGSKDARSGKPLLGNQSGCEFVDTIFGRDREMGNTEKLMTGIRLWSMRFDANCEDILRKP